MSEIFFAVLLQNGVYSLRIPNF